MDADFKAAMEALNKDDIQTYEEFLREWAREAISKHGGIYAGDGTYEAHERTATIIATKVAAE